MNSENPDVTNYSQFLTKEMPYFLEVSVLDGSCLLVGHIHVFFQWEYRLIYLYIFVNTYTYTGCILHIDHMSVS